MQALVIAPGKTAKVSTIPIPEPGPNEILVKVHSIALNPTDPPFVAEPDSAPGRVVGSDAAGTVAKLGGGVTSWSIGDRVAVFLQGATTPIDRPGAFAEYTIIEADLAFRIPDSVTFDQAATLPLCALTAAHTLFISSQIPAPFESPFPSKPLPTDESPKLLIYSAASSLGLFVIELAKLVRTSSGKSFRIFATASPKNHEKLKALGVEAVFDYNSPTWHEQVKEASGGITHAVDAFTGGDSVAKTSQTFGPAGGIIGVVRVGTWSEDGVRSDVKPVMSAAWMALGHEVVYKGRTLPAVPAWRDFTVAFYKFLSADKERLPIAPNPVRLLPGGLEGVVKYGFPLYGVGAKIDDPELSRPIAAEKVVFRVVE